MSRYEWNSKYILKTANDNLAVTLVDMKLYLKIDGSTEDVLITSLIETATDLVEQYTGIEVLNKTFTMYMDFFPFPKQYGNRAEENFNSYTIQVKRSKLNSITHIKYYINSVLTTFSNTLYSFSQDNQFSRIYLIDNGTVYPDTDDRKQAVEIEFIAGNGDDDTEVPESLKTAIKRIVAYLYANRGDCIDNCKICELAGAGAILNRWCIVEI